MLKMTGARPNGQHAATKKSAARNGSSSAKSTNGKVPFVMEVKRECDGEGWLVMWKIPAKDIPKVEGYAHLFGLPDIKTFLRVWENGRLPGQVRETTLSDRDLYNVLPKSAKVQFVGVPAKEMKLLASIAKYWSQSVQEMVHEAINGHVRCGLAEHLLHPETGQILHAEFADEYRTRTDVVNGRPVSERGY